MTRKLLAALFVTAVAFALTVCAEEPKKPDAPLDSKAAQDLATAKEKLLREEFDTFKNEVLKLKQRLETSDKEEDKATVKVLDSVLKEINNLAVDGKFDKVIESLTNDPTTFKAFQKANDIETANKELHVAMLKLIDLLQSGDDAKENRKKMEANQRLLEKLKEVLSKENRLIEQIDRNNKTGKDLAKAQNKIQEETKAALDPNAGKKADFKKSEAKEDGKPVSDAKGKAEAKNDTQGPKGEAKESKPGEARESKPGEAKESKPGEAKESKPGEAKESKPGEAKESKPGEAKESKPGESKESKPGEAKNGEPKDEKKPGEAKGGEAKEAKPGESKDGKPGDGKAGESKEAGKPNEGKPGDGKPGEAKENKGDAKSGEGKGKEAKPGESKGGKPGVGKEGKPSEGKPAEAKGGKPNEGKPGESKSGSDSKGQKEGKGDSKPGQSKPSQSKPNESKAGESKAKPPAGQPSQSPPSEGKGEGGESAPPPPPPSGPQMKVPVRKKIEDGAKDMEEAKDKLDKENKPGSRSAGGESGGRHRQGHQEPRRDYQRGSSGRDRARSGALTGSLRSHAGHANRGQGRHHEARRKASRNTPLQGR